MSCCCWSTTRVLRGITRTSSPLVIASIAPYGALVNAIWYNMAQRERRRIVQNGAMVYAQAGGYAVAEKSETGERLNVRITAAEMRMLNEMMQAWYPDKTRVQGAIVGRAIRLLYRRFQKEQK